MLFACKHFFLEECVGLKVGDAAGFCSAANHGVFLVDQVLVEGPSDDAAHAFSSNARHQASKVPRYSLLFIYFHEGICYAAIVLRLVFIVVLKVCTRSDEVKRICDCAAECVGTEGSC